MIDKTAEPTDPGIDNCDELENILPQNYRPLLMPREIQQAFLAEKKYIQENLCKKLKGPVIFSK